jgi:hypothetical protein
MVLGFIIWMIAGVNSLHPFHVSVCDVEYDTESRALQITHHIFLDDLEEALKKKFDSKFDITNPQNEQERDRYVETYIMEHFAVVVNGKPQEGNYLGHELEEGAMYCYIEIEGVKKLKSLLVKNTLLTDTFDDQVNLVHVKVDGKIKSLKLDKKNFSGQLDYDN